MQSRDDDMADFVNRYSPEEMSQSSQVKVKEEVGKAKRVRSSKTYDISSDEGEIELEAVEYKPSPPTTPPLTPKRRGRPPGSGKKGSPTKKVKKEGDESTKTGAWEKDELVQLYYAVYPKPVSWRRRACS